MSKSFISKLLIILLSAVLIVSVLPAAALASSEDLESEGGEEIDEEAVYQQQIIERAQTLYYHLCSQHESFESYIRLTGRDIESYEDSLRHAQWYSSAVETIMSYSEVLGNVLVCLVESDYQGVVEAAASAAVNQITEGVFPKLSADQFIYSQAKSGRKLISLQKLYDFWEIFTSGEELIYDEAFQFILAVQTNKLGFAALKMGKAYYMDQLSQSPWKYAGKIAFDVLVSQVLGKVVPDANESLSFMEEFLYDILEDDLIALAHQTNNPFIQDWQEEIAEIEAESRRLLRLDRTDPRLYPEHTVYFDPNGGWVSQESMTVHETLPYGNMPRPVLFGYGFDGWFDDPEGGKQYTYWDPYELEEDQTLYAHWTLLKLAHGTCGEDLEWAVWGNGLLEITGTGAMTEAPWLEDWSEFISDVLLPDGLTEICNYAFDGMTEMTDIVLPTSLRRLGDYAFQNSGLLSLSLPEGLQYVGCGLLKGNTGVKTLAFPASVTETGYASSYIVTRAEVVVIISERNLKHGVLTQSAVEQVIFRSGVTKIWDGVCSNAPELSSVSIPSTVTEIGIHSFAGCPKLKSLQIPDSVLTIDHGAFGMEEYTTGVAPRSIDFSAEPTLIGEASGLESLTLPAHLRTLESGILMGNTKVTTLTIPATVTDASAVTRMSAVAEVTVQEGMTVLPEGIFMYGSALRQISLPAGLLEIGDYAFADTGLESLELPDSLQKIGLMILAGNSGVTEIVIPAGVTSMVYDLTDSWYPMTAFSNSSVSRLEFAEGATSVPQYACYGLSSLNTLTLPSSVKNIGKEAFRNSSLYILNYHPADFPVIGESAFRNTSLPYMLLIPDQIILSYADTEGPDLKPYLIPDSYENTAYQDVMSNGGFRWNIDNEEILRGTEDGRLVIWGTGTTELTCTLATWYTTDKFTVTVSSDDLRILHLPAGLKEIGEEAFSGLNVQIVELPAELQRIGIGAFRNCPQLVRVNMPDQVNEIAPDAFSACPNVTLFCESDNTAYGWAQNNNVQAVIPET